MDVPGNVKQLSNREVRELVKKRDLDAERGFCVERQFRVELDMGEQAFVIRKRAGLTLVEAAAAVGISKVTLIKYERNDGAGILGYVQKLLLYNSVSRKRAV